ncbi:unnamed protein product, partial [Laminaria digitata]
MALLWGISGEDDICAFFCFYSIYQWAMYRQLVEPTSFPGLCPQYDFFEVLGGFDFKELLRFEKPHFLQLLGELELPENIVIPRGYGVSKVPAKLALAVTLWRLAAPTTLIRDTLFWGMSETLICEIFNLTIEAIFDRWGHLVKELQVDAILPKLDVVCKAISDAGAPLDRCWGFIDGTIRKISRPWRWQRKYYNGWKRVHSVKYQAV